MDETEVEHPPEDYFFRVVHHGREYHQLSLLSNTYLVPVDEIENERLQIAHFMFSVVFENRLVFPEIRPTGNVLDCGTGTANWALAVALKYPQSQVYGIDISTEMMPELYPGNLRLEQGNLNEGLAYRDNSFELVHSRLVAGGIDRCRWPRYLREIYRVLAPGGWCQMVEICFKARSEEGQLTEEHALSHWSRNYMEAMEDAGKNPRAGSKLKEWMDAAGFSRTEMEVIKLPTCGWAANEKDFNIGCANQENVQRLLSSLALYPLTTFQGMPINDFHVLVAQARHEATSIGLKPYFVAYVAVGRKPRR